MLTKPFLRHPQMIQITGARVDQIQTWVNRGHVEIDDANPGRGKSRLYSELDAVKVALIVRLNAFGIDVAQAAAFSRYMGKTLIEGGRIEWEDYIEITFRELYQAGSKPLFASEKWIHRSISTGDLEDIRVAAAAEWFRGLGPRRRDGEGEIDPEQRHSIASEGYFAEPVMYLPHGEIVNGTRAWVSRIRERMQAAH